MARALKDRPAAAPLDPDIRSLIELAEQVTQTPPACGPAEVAAAARAARAPAEYLDAVGVMLGFNFVTRVANALGVELDVPPWARRVEPVWRAARAVVILALKWLVDLRPRPFAGRPAAENLAALERVCGEIGLPMPPALRRLAAAPHLLEVQRELWEALLCRGGPPEGVGRSREWFMTAGLVVLDEIGADYAGAVADWFAGRRPEVPGRVRAWLAGDGPAEGFEVPAAEFARDVTRRSWTITPERIDGLRAAGLDDGDVLDLVAGISLWNALGRLELLLPDQRAAGFIPAEAQTAGIIPAAH